MIHKIISGGQTGADQAGLLVARRFGLQTGGRMPRGFRTRTGFRPDLARLYGLIEDRSGSYWPRTVANVCDSDGTMRLAGNFHSAGELATMRALQQMRRPFLDVDLSWPPDVTDAARWIERYRIQILNVAGNSEETFPGAFTRSVEFLTCLFTSLGLQPVGA